LKEVPGVRVPIYGLIIKTQPEDRYQRADKYSFGYRTVNYGNEAG